MSVTWDKRNEESTPIIKRETFLREQKNLLRKEEEAEVGRKEDILVNTHKKCSCSEVVLWQ